MKKSLLILLTVTGSLLAQEAAQPAQTAPKPLPKFSSNLVERRQAPTFSDVNCSGFMTKDQLPMSVVLIGGERSPDVAQFAGKEKQIFLKGEGLAVGNKYRLMRRIKNPNGTLIYPEQKKMLRDAGDQWADLGIVHVTQVVNGTGIAVFDLSCQPAVVGDVAIPYSDRPEIALRGKSFEFTEFGVPESSSLGRIIQAKDFDYLLGNGKKVYLDIGQNKGLKAGDYLRVTRSYNTDVDSTPVDALSSKATTIEDTNDRMPDAKENQRTGLRSARKRFDKDMPRRGVGELVVLWTTPNSAVAMVTFAREDIHIGDQVEVDTTQPQQQAEAK